MVPIVVNGAIACVAEQGSMKIHEKVGTLIRERQKPGKATQESNAATRGYEAKGPPGTPVRC